MEQWKDIEGYKGLYQVSNGGRVKSLARIFYSGKDYHIKKKYPEKLVAISHYSTGYCYVVLCKDGLARKFKVHRLVASAFIPNHDGLPCVDHINCVRDDNRAENLRWVDNITNQNNPITRKNKSLSKMGDKNPMKKKCRPVLQIDYATGIVLAEYDSCKEAARRLATDSGNISRCCNGKKLKHKGYAFRFKSNV